MLAIKIGFGHMVCRTRIQQPLVGGFHPPMDANVYTIGYAWGVLVETLSVRETRRQLPSVLKEFGDHHAVRHRTVSR